MQSFSKQFLTKFSGYLTITAVVMIFCMLVAQITPHAFAQTASGCTNTTGQDPTQQSFIKWLFNNPDPTQFCLDSVTYILDKLHQVLVSVVAWEALIALLMTAYAYLTAFGDPAKAEGAKKRITWIVVGVVIVILSEIIIYEVRRLAYTGIEPPVEQIQNIGTNP